VETLGLADSVSFLEYADEGTVQDLYLRAACLVLPSLGEGFGLPVLEAMACGLPVITPRVSSLAEVAGDAVVTVNPYDSIELSDAMHRVLADRDSARTCDAAASSGPGSLPGGRRPSRYQ
jgi:glycosyltransferase involved in cell wall biosynthesis